MNASLEGENGGEDESDGESMEAVPVAIKRPSARSTRGHALNGRDVRINHALDARLVARAPNN